MALLALIPIGTGALGIITGLSIGPGADSVRTDYFDGEYRFLDGVWLTLGLVLLHTLRNPRRHRT